MKRNNNIIGPFPGHVKPVRPGLYPRRIYASGRQTFSYWNGKYWCVGDPWPSQAMENQHLRSLYQDKPWFGLKCLTGLDAWNLTNEERVKLVNFMLDYCKVRLIRDPQGGLHLEALNNPQRTTKVKRT